MKSIKKKIFSNKKSKKHIGGSSHIENIKPTLELDKLSPSHETNITQELSKTINRDILQNNLKINLYSESELPPLNTLIENGDAKSIINITNGGYNYIANNSDNSDRQIYVIYSNKYLGSKLSNVFSQDEIIFYEFFELLLTLQKLDKSHTMNEKQVIIIRDANRFFKCNGEDKFYDPDTAVLNSPDVSVGKFTKIKEEKETGPVDFLAIDGKPRSKGNIYLNTLKFMFNKAYIGFKTALNQGYKHIHIGDWIIGSSSPNNKLGHNPLVMYYLQVLAAIAVNSTSGQGKKLKLIYSIDNEGIEDIWCGGDAYTNTAQTLLTENLKNNLTLDQHLYFLDGLDKQLNMKFYVPFKTLLNKKLIKIDAIRAHLKKNLTPKPLQHLPHLPP
jgi:hypothetical protein